MSPHTCLGEEKPRPERSDGGGNFEETRREGSAKNNFWCSPRVASTRNFARACVYFARSTIAIAKIREYSQSSPYGINFNPLSPNSDQNEISLYIITTCSNIQVMRLEEVIAKDKMS